ncbi:hypothetical protein [Leuconostoc mesenteroides]|uniref:hypothetical protein n=1 Tax=Leuconostoc mesenteroides TaxID=1245 RepID=UPI0003D81AC7|nr:hypothetical protein [Leuconostoc mesenteroides]AHF19148.1 hypothetical protein LMES_0932 [Leuconostoc mesenteroides KFRI-MG]ASR67992.1 hypothetical protein CBW60_00805 [Leuconostoc mesenteroides]AWV37855.1 hypothetical protein CD198_04960 [Leuconostoc mesenteroides]MBU7546904.1 hypothetical protein [Leuconostoc mesenteroides]MCV2529757.1 hypothetical protein [Leuconostoc mesenteroides]
MIRQKHLKFFMLIFLGGVIGYLMQMAPHLKYQWSQNIITFMATDLGSWAVITLIICSYSDSWQESAMNTVAFMWSMVITYYVLNPLTATGNLHWIVLAILMLPIGAIGYFYKTKISVALLFIIGCLFALTIQIMTIIKMVTLNQMIVQNQAGILIIVHQTWFAYTNRILLALITISGMFAVINYWRIKLRKGKQSRVINN